MLMLAPVRKMQIQTPSFSGDIAIVPSHKDMYEVFFTLALPLVIM
jgi:hypothetical protein